MQNDKEKIVELNFPNVFRPTRKKLIQAVDVIFRLSVEHIHQLRKAKDEVVDKFFAACIDIGVSNLKAIVQLGEPYLNEVGNIMRNLNETCADFFWLASINIENKEKAKKIAENFFNFHTYRFINGRERLEKIFAKDIFLRDLKNPYSELEKVNKAKERCKGYKPDHSQNWRYDKSMFNNVKDVDWSARSVVAARFVEENMNLKNAPYLNNLKILSAYSHFDPIQLQEYIPEYRERIFDRNLNICIAFVYDMIIYSYKCKRWKAPDALVILQNNNFLWHST